MKRTDQVDKSRSASPERERAVALLRGINVGGNRSVPMADLAAIFAEAGGADVRTYIQSGNVVFSAARVAEVGRRAESLLLQKFGFSVPIMVRTAARMAFVRDHNPFLAEGCGPASLHVGFLAEGAKDVALDPNRSPGDRFARCDGEIYLHLPNGVARTKLTNDWFDRALGTVCTVRNWRTVLVLNEMVRTAT